MSAHHVDLALEAELAWRQEVIRAAAGLSSRHGGRTGGRTRVRRRA